MCLKILIREMLFYGEKETWDQITPVKFSKKHVPPDFNSRKKGSIARKFSKSVNLTSVWSVRAQV